MAYYKKPSDGLNAVQRYHAKCDAITIRPKKADGERIRSAASVFGFTSTTQFIMAAISEYMERHTNKNEQEG